MRLKKKMNKTRWKTKKAKHYKSQGRKDFQGDVKFCQSNMS